MNMSGNVRLILQARLNSTRLPGKMLLPMGNLPLIILCAKRLSRDGTPLVVATSTAKSDDPLCNILAAHNIKFVRGPLDDVLARFVVASEDMDENDIVVRVTGDNPAVDADFIAEIISHHKTGNTDYTRSLSPIDRLPYGLSAEVIGVKALRRLHAQDLPAEDREHVTSWLTKQGKFSLFSSPVENDLSHLRVTVDTFKDYLRMADLFQDVKDPVNVSWREIITRLETKPDTPLFRSAYRMKGLKPQSRMALGTAQFGMPYGIANQSGKPDLQQARSIVSTALDYGVTSIDTAAAYGTAEETLGHCLNGYDRQSIEINTKLDPSAFSNENMSASDVRNAVEASIYRSCRRLDVKTLSCVMLHRWQHYASSDGKIWENLVALKAGGVIGTLGASIQSPEEGLQALDVEDIKFIQMPFNILDWRWKDSGFIDRLSGRPDIHIQARSTLLQGLLTLSADRWPIIGADHAEKVVSQLKKLCEVHNRKSIPDLCYAYARSMEWIDDIVVGMETEEQLRDNLILFNTPELDNVDQVAATIPRLDTDLLNPAKWH